jgi:hypothetical protein
MSNGFEQHNIDHLSASSINMSMGSLSAWCVRYLMAQRFPSSAAAERGKAVEVGVAHGLFNPDVSEKECVELGIDAFRGMMDIGNFVDSDEREATESDVSAMIPLALAELRPLGVPTPSGGTNQHEIGIACRFAEGENGTVHIKGYLDFYYADQELIVDLKTTKRSPSSWSQSHAIQAAIYGKATGAKVKFLYVTPKKTVWLELDDITAELSINAVKGSVKRLERFLSLSKDAELLTKSAPHDPSSFYWKGAESLESFIS